MSTAPFESFGPEAEHAPDLRLVPELTGDDVHDGIQAHLGAFARVAGYDATLVKDYRGPASNKVQFDGRMLVRVDVADSDEPLVLTVDENNQLFSDAVRARLGAIAEANFVKGKGTLRDF